MANFHRKRNVAQPAAKMCKRHPNVPALPERDLCVNCAAYADRAKRERGAAPPAKR